MEYLVYKSKALVEPGSAACRDIVTTSQYSNARHDLTGFLHAEKGLFIQYIEGANAPLWATYDRICNDRRHTKIQLIGCGVLNRPRFREWRMGYSDANVLGFNDFLAEVSFMNQCQRSSGMAEIIFLMAVSARIDLGIVDPPQNAWPRNEQHSHH